MGKIDTPNPAEKMHLYISSNFEKSSLHQEKVTLKNHLFLFIELPEF